MDGPVLQARVNELERQVQHLQTMFAELQKEREEVFYKWVKEDFVALFMLHTSEIVESYEPSKRTLDKYWLLWKETFNEKWSSSTCHEQMMVLMGELLEEHPLDHNDRYN